MSKRSNPFSGPMYVDVKDLPELAHRRFGATQEVLPSEPNTQDESCAEPGIALARSGRSGRDHLRRTGCSSVHVCAAVTSSGIRPKLPKSGRQPWG